MRSQRPRFKHWRRHRDEACRDYSRRHGCGEAVLAGTEEVDDAEASSSTKEQADYGRHERACKSRSKVFPEDGRRRTRAAGSAASGSRRARYRQREGDINRAAPRETKETKEAREGAAGHGMIGNDETEARTRTRRPSYPRPPASSETRALCRQWEAKRVGRGMAAAAAASCKPGCPTRRGRSGVGRVAAGAGLVSGRRLRDSFLDGQPASRPLPTGPAPPTRLCLSSRRRRRRRRRDVSCWWWWWWSSPSNLRVMARRRLHRYPRVPLGFATAPDLAFRSSSPLPACPWR